MIWRGIAAAIVALALGGIWLRPAPVWQFALSEGAAVGTGSFFQTVFTYASPVGTAHSPALRVRDDGFDIFWFDGTAESKQDVRILGTTVSKATADRDIREILTTSRMSSMLSPPQRVLVLGNTISDQASGHIATVVSAGGWAAATLTHVTDGTARKLNLSPILNRSHLAKSPVIDMQGGMTLIPAYFEMGNGYGVAALVDADYRVRAQAAIPTDSAAIQPMIVPTSPQNAVAIFRRFDKTTDRLLASWTDDGGKSWTRTKALTLPNPDAPVAAVRLSDGRILMLYNDAADRADTLRFAVSSDGGRTWQPGRRLDGPGKGALRYPMMMVLGNGRIAATYSTGSKSGIVAHEFSADWAVQP